MDSTLAYALVGCGVVAALSWLAGVLAREHSWVDRGWSILPVGYVAWFAYATRFQDGRLVLMAALTFAWGARLTYNFARKGGYSRGGEDYRWQVLRAKMTRWQWELFAFGFIAGFQNAILLAIALPAWIAARASLTHTARPLGVLDLCAAFLFVVFLAGEVWADEEQWRFHQKKRAAAERGVSLDPPFCTTGPFRYSRHLNFFCEQGLWWALYLFGIAATGELFNVSVVGPIVLTALFQGSTQFTESITLSKYPAYAEYRRRTSRLFPLWPRRSEGANVLTPSRSGD
ncbi:MAG: DUF1295 domain-containing protein [Polyangiaceae bacterium]